MAWVLSGPERWVADPWISRLNGAVSLWHNSISGSTSGISWEKRTHVFWDCCLLVGHYCQIRQSGSHLLSLPLLPDRPQTRSWCVTTLQALNRCQMASGSIGTAQMVYWTWFYKFKADELQIQCLFQLKKALYIAYKCKECLGNWQSIMVHKLFPIPSIRYACREWW